MLQTAGPQVISGTVWTRTSQGDVEQRSDQPFKEMDNYGMSLRRCYNSNSVVLKANLSHK